MQHWHTKTSPAQSHDALKSPATVHCASITARTPLHGHHTPHTTHHRAPRTPHRTHRKNTPSHTRLPRHTSATYLRAVRLLSVDGMLPESWLLCKYKFLQDTRRVTQWHPTPLPNPAIRPQRISAHRMSSINHITCNHIALSYILSLLHNTVCGQPSSHSTSQ